MKQDSTNEITYLLATIGSLTERGGRVTTATRGSAIASLGMARVGDVATYPDGSVLDNEDVINDSPDRRDRAVAFVPVRSSISVH
ncbi:hypothetical protein PQR67_27080 [Paraburkholderia fungorum]|uniref:hypothetical protein n=1 Tax=Paraburkholderia fungorum TaxID=134537 RepID=UPI0038BD5683